MLNPTLQEKTHIIRARKNLKEINQIKIKDVSEKENGYGTNHFFQVLIISLLQELIELKDMAIPIWENNGKYYLKTNAVKHKEAQVENGF